MKSVREGITLSNNQLDSHSLKEENAALHKQIAELQERLLAQYQMMEITTSHLSDAIFRLELEREESLHKTEELKANNAALSESLQTIARQRKQITESIRYASRIQRAIFAKQTPIQQVLSNSFFLHLPKNNLSGDFAFIAQKRHLIYIALGDCTGHGVPASMLTIVSHMLLSRLIEDADAYVMPSQILHTLDFLFNEYLTGSNPNVRDGLEIGLCMIDTKENVLHYSGARQPLYRVRQDGIQEYKSSKDTVGWSLRGYLDKSFETIHIPFEKGNNGCFYLATDGFFDQFNLKGRKLMRKNFKKILENICRYPITEQEGILHDIFYEWKGNSKQIDDVGVIGFAI
ncbi:SpoIIE family protein phosphatase [Rhodoflexus sp.]